MPTPWPGSSRCWDLNDVCKRIALEAISGWGFDTDLHVRVAGHASRFGRAELQAPVECIKTLAFCAAACTQAATSQTFQAADACFQTVPVQAVRDLSMPHPVGTLVDDAAHAVHTVLMDPIYKLKPWSKVVRKGLRDLKEYDKWMQGFTRQ